MTRECRNTIYQGIPEGALSWLVEANELVLRHERRDQPRHSLELNLGDVVVHHAWDGIRFETVVANDRTKGFVDRQQLPSVDPRSCAPAAFAEELIRTIESFRKRSI
jgi:hypothetical protein